MEMTRGRLILLTTMLGLLSVMGPASMDPFLPSIPNIARGLATTPNVIIQSLSAISIGNALGQLIHGPLSDRYGRKPVIVGVLIVYVAAAFGAALSPNVEILIAWRFLQGLAMAGGRILGTAVARDLFERERLGKMMSDIMMVMAMGTLIGPIIGGLIAQYLPWQSIFVVMAIFGVVVFLMIVFLYTETVPRKDPMALEPSRLAANMRTVAVNPVFLRYAFCAAFTMAGFGAFIAVASPLMIGIYGIEPITFGLYFTLITICFLAGTLISGRLVGRMGMTRLIGIGAVLVTLAGLSMMGMAVAGVHVPLAAVLPMGLYMVGVAQIFPQTSAGAIQPFGAIAGVASSLLGFCQQTVAGVVIAVVGLLPVNSPIPMAAGVMLMALTSASIYWFGIRREASGRA